MALHPTPGPAGLVLRVRDAVRRALTSWLDTARSGRVRVVVLRGRHAVAAVVSVEDYWFLRQLEEALAALGWRPGETGVSPDRIARAVMDLSRVAADRDGRLPVGRSQDERT